MLVLWVKNWDEAVTIKQLDWKNDHFKQSYRIFNLDLHDAPDHLAIFLTDLVGRTVKIYRVRYVPGSNPGTGNKKVIGL